MCKQVLSFIFVVVVSLPLFSQSDFDYQKYSFGIGYHFESTGAILPFRNLAYSESIKGNSSFNLSGIVEYRFTPKLGLRTGISYHSFGYDYVLDNLAFQEDYPPNSFTPRYSEAVYTIEVQNIEIPLIFLLTSSFGQSSIYFGPGFTYQATLGSSSSGELRYSDNGELHGRNSDFTQYNAELNSSFLSFAFLFGYSLQFEKNFRFNIEPMLRLSLSPETMPVHSNEIRQYSIGIGAGVYYTLPTTVEVVKE